MTDEQDQELLRVALHWLELGFRLLPCYKNSKMFYKGYGPRVKQITTVQEITQWFIGSQINIAVMGGQDVITLDFDDPGLYKFWSARYPYIKTTLTGKTPGGGYHVWFSGTMPDGINLVDGVELKASVMVYPSVVDNKQYSPERGRILAVHDLSIFSSLSKPGFRSPYVMQIVESNAKNYQSPERIGWVIDRIKAHYSITDMLLEVDPGLWSRLRQQDQDHWIGRCPFHDDKGQHFWINTKLNKFGCWVCYPKSGDVINLYAKLKDLPIKSAIVELRGRLQHG